MISSNLLFFFAVTLMIGNVSSDLDQQLGWRMWSTSEPADLLLESPVSQKGPGSGGDTEALSRDQVLIDLLRHDPRELHVEDFLWTGSGKVSHC